MNLTVYKWVAASISIFCSVIQATVMMWTYVSYLEKDKARLTQQVIFIILSFFAVYNWFKHR